MNKLQIAKELLNNSIDSMPPQVERNYIGEYIGKGEERFLLENYINNFSSIEKGIYTDENDGIMLKMELFHLCFDFILQEELDIKGWALDEDWILGFAFVHRADNKKFKLYVGCNDVVIPFYNNSKSDMVKVETIEEAINTEEKPYEMRFSDEPKMKKYHFFGSFRKDDFAITIPIHSVDLEYEFQVNSYGHLMDFGDVYYDSKNRCLMHQLKDETIQITKKNKNISCEIFDYQYILSFDKWENKLFAFCEENNYEKLYFEFIRFSPIEVSYFGYVYYFNIHNHEYENEIQPLRVYVLTDYETMRNGRRPGISRYIKRYIDLNSEEIKIEVIENPYFKKAEIVNYAWGFNGVEYGSDFIDESAAKKMVKNYCLDVKNNNISLENKGENGGFFYRD